MGIGKDRLHLAWVSSAEAQRFAQIVTEATNAVKELGPFDKNKFQLELDAAEMTFTSETIRWLVGKEVKITTKGDVYGRKWDEKTYESILDSTLKREYEKNLIYQAIKSGSVDPRDISEKTGLYVGRVSYLLADMEKTSMVEFKGMNDKVPEFATL